MITDLMEMETKEALKDLSAQDVFDVMWQLCVKHNPDAIKEWKGQKEKFAMNMAMAYVFARIQDQGKRSQLNQKGESI
jgi:hypothetical protein